MGTGIAGAADGLRRNLMPHDNHRQKRITAVLLVADGAQHLQPLGGAAQIKIKQQHVKRLMQENCYRFMCRAGFNNGSDAEFQQQRTQHPAAVQIFICNQNGKRVKAVAFFDHGLVSMLGNV
jgi:hypothetical protein